MRTVRVSIPITSPRLVRAAVAALALATSPGSGVRQLCAQPADSIRTTVPPAPDRWHLQLSNFYSTADNGFGVWTGQDVRLLYSAKRVSPFVNVGTQQRPNGRQEAVGAGAYVVLTPWMYSIVGLGLAPDRGTVLFPRVRADASLFVAVPGVKGVLVNGGMTDLRFSQKEAGGQILSLGSTIYRGRGIYTGAVFLNRDRASNARSHSWQVGSQWGVQGRFWVGGSLGVGNEAYRLISATPFDARFENRFVTGFVSKWLTRRTGLSLRLDYERKVDVYHRQAAGLSYFVDF